MGGLGLTRLGLAAKHQRVLRAHLQELGNVASQGDGCSRGFEAAAPFEKRRTGLIVQIGAEANTGRALVVEGAGNGLRHGPAPASDLADVQVLHAVRGEEPSVLSGEPFAGRDIVEIDQRAAIDGDGRGGHCVASPPCPRDLAGRDRRRVAEDVGELGQGRGVGPEIGQHLAQARDREIRGVERAVLAPGVVEAMVPAAELAGNRRERCRGMAEAPAALR